MNFANGLEQFGALGPFEEVTRGAGRKCVENILRVLIHGKHDYLDCRGALFQLPDAFNAVHAGQVDIHEDYVGIVFGQGFEGGLSIAIMAYTLEPVDAANYSRESRTELFVVLNYGNRNRHGFNDFPREPSSRLQSRDPVRTS